MPTIKAAATQKPFISSSHVYSPRKKSMHLDIVGVRLRDQLTYKSVIIVMFYFAYLLLCEENLVHNIY